MAEEKQITQNISDITSADSKTDALAKVRAVITDLNYTIVETDENRPWGGYYRLTSEDADRFIAEFFPGLTLQQAKLGRENVELSPKFLLVCPGQRLSWQYHHRRAERWRFLTSGAYHASKTDDQGQRVEVDAGTVVQFEAGERHRLCATDTSAYTLVAEIWQHTDPNAPSNEEDIVRLADDYKRDGSS